jgi:aryl-alcohol dehydrogenase-like predicted oxidoreductase
MDRRMDDKAWKQRPNGHRHQIHLRLPRRPRRQRDPSQHLRQRLQITLHLCRSQPQKAPNDELMQSLNYQVAAGRVLYLGASDIPAWVVSKANEYARSHGLRGFSVYQGNWAADKRDFERDIIPMCINEGLGICPWGALGGGNYKTDAQRESSEGRNLEKMGRKVPESAIEVSKVLEKIASRKGIEGQLTSVALAYVMHKTPYVFPIVGGRKIDHLKGNIEALGLELTDEDMNEIEGAVPFDLGFPMTMCGNGPSNSWLVQIAGHFDFVPPVKPLPAHKKE